MPRGTEQRRVHRHGCAEERRRECVTLQRGLGLPANGRTRQRFHVAALRGSDSASLSVCWRARREPCPLPRARTGREHGFPHRGEKFLGTASPPPRRTVPGVQSVLPNEGAALHRPAVSLACSPPRSCLVRRAPPLLETRLRASDPRPLGWRQGHMPCPSTEPLPLLRYARDHACT